ncbi:MAG: GMC family oxidoreductase [Chitinophagales bacterium]|nr:GMC family oxidoreductase [Chitinophagales bacterium]
MQNYDFDYVIMGSGFGGSVSALRLAEKGYKVLVVERGKWYKSTDFPKTNWNLPKWLWFPKIHFFGIMKISIFNHVSVISGAGVGGGSLVYANTLPVPKKAFYNSGSWAQLKDWENVLQPYYKTALKMLGATKNTWLGDSDMVVKEVAKRLGKEDKFEPTNVAVYFGEAGKEVPDPYFNGKGPTRTGCTHCGACMTGCRYNAKNTLDKNYLHLAQQLGAEIWAEKEIIDVVPLSNNGSEGYEITIRTSTSFIKKKQKIRSKGIIFSGGVIGTVKLLLQLKKKGSLPNLSNQLGNLIRTNNEALIPVTSINTKGKDYSKGLAIGSILHTDENTHLEPCRYAPGSGFWRVLMLPMVSGNNIFYRITKTIINFLKKPVRFIRLVFVRDWAKNSPIILFMQTIDSTLKFSLNGIGRMNSKVSTGAKPSPFIKEAHDIAHQFADIIDGEPTNLSLETLFGIPSTAHILGGCVMGKTEKEGVVNEKSEVFGYQNMLVCDGSTISANPGVNPSLSITAISEHAMAQIMPLD